MKTIQRRPRLRSFHDHDRRGAAMVECALVLPIMATLAMGIAEFGQALKVSQTLSQAAREGARVSIDADTTTAEVTQLVENMVVVGAGVNATDVTVQVSVLNADGTAAGSNEVANATNEQYCRVEVSLPFTAVRFVPTNFLGTSNLRGYCVMRQQ